MYEGMVSRVKYATVMVLWITIRDLEAKAQPGSGWCTEPCTACLGRPMEGIMHAHLGCCKQTFAHTSNWASDAVFTPS